MQLIYLSPVPWNSFSQRPHKFVAWFQAKEKDEVLWVNPYLTRFPLPADLRYLRLKNGNEQLIKPDWIRVITPPVLPIEPLPGSRCANGLLWRKTLNALHVFANRRQTLLAVGKPSLLALAALKRLHFCASLYDAMDDFPDFYSGISRLTVRKREQEIARRVDMMFVSSSGLKQRWEGSRPDVWLVRNGLDVSTLPADKRYAGPKEKNVLGYTGTIASWFDWDWVITLAKERPRDIVRLIGPVFTHVPSFLPENIELLPPVDHQAAMEAMSRFDLGLIPFKRNRLTASVDPIKYYEYRALGLPVVSTNFGEMTLRAGEDGVFLSFDFKDIANVIEGALRYRPDDETIRQFRAKNSWDARFELANIN